MRGQARGPRSRRERRPVKVPGRPVSSRAALLRGGRGSWAGEPVPLESPPSRLGTVTADNGTDMGLVCPAKAATLLALGESRSRLLGGGRDRAGSPVSKVGRRNVPCRRWASATSPVRPVDDPGCTRPSLTALGIKRPVTKRKDRGIDTLDSQLFGFRITRQVGIGAGSKIYIAVNLKSGDTCAVKHVVRETADEVRFLTQAETEYEVCSKLDHPNLRRCFALHRIRKLLQTRELLLVMEYIDGLNLEKARPNRLKTFLKLFHKVAAGLDAMHEAGYIHTDIKPTNIMLAQGGAVKIIDFGQSCPIGHRKERIQGTPDYIAPEQVSRLRLGQRTDVFNLGATMYWLLTSEKYPTAIRGADSRGGISLISSDRPVAPIELNDKIPISLSKLVMECCREDPAERPADMKEVMARLAVVEKLWRTYRESVRTKRGATTPSSATGATQTTKENE